MRECHFSFHYALWEKKSKCKIEKKDDLLRLTCCAFDRFYKTPWRELENWTGGTASDSSRLLFHPTYIADVVTNCVWLVWLTVSRGSESFRQEKSSNVMIEHVASNYYLSLCSEKIISASPNPGLSSIVAKATMNQFQKLKPGDSVCVCLPFNTQRELQSTATSQTRRRRASTEACLWSWTLPRPTASSGAARKTGECFCRRK